ncbi:hypothetical protein IR120_06345 [Muribacter muris]|uniref:hypothetical protein n=1 Tax=Muribacter muris TaxID=67855 RepID=UPI001431E2B9|nr:hypothetical protein [Muribacter muris]MBF0785085.1 hypothetical protein [Muribacter muris]MBF0826901.1 hypothetical protein [Muribacter muris]
MAVLGAILSGKTTAETAVAGLSPELNAQIHTLTKDNKAANFLRTGCYRQWKLTQRG